MGKLRPGGVAGRPRSSDSWARRGVQIVASRTRVASRAQARGSELGCRARSREDRGRGAGAPAGRRGGREGRARGARGAEAGALVSRPAGTLAFASACPAPRPARGAPAAWRWDGGRRAAEAAAEAEAAPASLGAPSGAAGRAAGAGCGRAMSSRAPSWRRCSAATRCGWRRRRR